MKHHGPFIHDSLDRPNIQPQVPITPKLDWRIFGVAGIIALITLFVFVWIVIQIFGHVSQIYLYSNSNIFVFFSNFIIWFLYFVPVFAIITGLYHVNMYLSVITKRAKLINVMQYQTTISKLDDATKVADQFMRIMNERAKKSQFAGVQTLTYDKSKTVHHKDELEKLLQEPIIDETYLPEGNEPILIALREKGLINRSNNSILIGFGEKKK